MLLVAGNSTFVSENRTFAMGFFSTDLGSYLGIRYASILTPTYVWVANRESPVKNLTSARAEIGSDDGRFRVVDSRDTGEEIVVWRSANSEKATAATLLDSGNLVLLSSDRGGAVVWQSFDFPGDTFLPGMKVTATRSITCWRSPSDPGAGRYSLRLRPPQYGEFELVYNLSRQYWSSGNWTGGAFVGVPEMRVRYIYEFEFANPFTPEASFGYREVAPPDGGLRAPLPFTCFKVDPFGQLQQYTWSTQTESWDMFWSQPDNPCRVYGLCGGFGFCDGTQKARPCSCLGAAFSPADGIRWRSCDYSGGCRRDGGCDGRDEFDEIGAVDYDGAVAGASFPGTRPACEKSCLSDCSCVGFRHNSRSNMCGTLYGSMLNLQNLTPVVPPPNEDVIYIRRSRGLGTNSSGKRGRGGDRILLFVGGIAGFVLVISAVLFALRRRRRLLRRRKKEEGESVFPATNLEVFTHKDLHAATRGFSEKLGQGGFGAVFRGELPDSSPVAVKRLERPGGGEREFRAEVATLGNIQHVNLVRLRGFCCEDAHRLLVYDYMPNGPLSAYLRRYDGECLSWEARFRVAVGTARGIAYLHEECRDRIIHCDIKPENILLDADLMAKVSDFGLSKLIGRDFSRVLATMRGTWGYVAPEWISGVAITAKADVYSYGMTLLELIGGRRNVEPPPPDDGGGGVDVGLTAAREGWFFPPWAARQVIDGNVAAVVDRRLGGAYSYEEAARVALVAVWCIQDDEDARPAMGTVVKMLEGVVAVGIPPPPMLLQALVSGESFRGVAAVSGDFSSTGGGGNQVSGDSHACTSNLSEEPTGGNCANV